MVTLPFAHLLFLSRPLLAAPECLVPAVYAEPRRGRLHPVPASTPELEGVGCVDDAARAAMVCFWASRNGHLEAGDMTVGFLRFLRYMQTNDGFFANFVFDWSGSRNVDGVTSIPGGPWWFARAMLAFAVCSEGHPQDCLEPLAKGLPNLLTPFTDSRVQALAVLALIEMGRRGDLGDLRDACDSSARHLAHQVSLQVPRAPSRYWGEIQEGVLAVAGAVLERPLLVKLAVASATARFASAPATLLHNPELVAYDASSLVWTCRQLRSTSRVSWVERVERASHLWFRGRNAAAAPTMACDLGVFFDGVDGARVSQNAGAESAVEGLSAIFDVFRPSVEPLP